MNTLLARNQVSSRELPVRRGSLIVRLPNWVGEAVLALPTLRMLHDTGFDLHLMGKSWASELFAAYEWPVYVRAASRRAATAQMSRLRKEISSADPSFRHRINTVLLTNSHSSALEARCAGLQPLGYGCDWRSYLLARSVRPAPALHVADAYWRIGATLIGSAASPIRTPSVLLSSAEHDQRARVLLRDQGIAGRYTVLCPFTGTGDTHHARRWPGFPEFARQLATKALPVVVCPGPGEEAEARRSYAGLSILTGVSLGVYAALMRQSWCIVANDTGPGHIAAATGARLLSILGPDASIRWNPLGPRVTMIAGNIRWPHPDEVMARLPPR